MSIGPDDDLNEVGPYPPTHPRGQRGIRPHLPMTAAEAEQRRRIAADIGAAFPLCPDPAATLDRALGAHHCPTWEDPDGCRCTGGGERGQAE